MVWLISGEKENIVLLNLHGVNLLAQVQLSSLILIDWVNNMKMTYFVGDIDNGNLYHFDLNKDRTELVLEGPLADKLADSDDENEGIIFGEGFGAITDIEVGPDGYLYIVGIQGTIYRIVPNQA